MKTLDDFLSELPEDEQAEIEARARELIAQEMTLQQVRKARRFTQQQLAQSLGIGQDGISRLEHRTDLLISTLRSYIEAMGGSLKLVAEFPGMAPVMISSIGDEGPAENRPDTSAEPQASRAPTLPIDAPRE